MEERDVFDEFHAGDEASGDEWEDHYLISQAYQDFSFYSSLLTKYEDFILVKQGLLQWSCQKKKDCQFSYVFNGTVDLWTGVGAICIAEYADEGKC